MGTSQTCKGPSNKSPLEPDWLNTDFQSAHDNDEDKIPSDTTRKILILPNDSVGYKDRFRVARNSLSRYLKTGDKSYLKKSISSYIRNSGGAGIVASHHYVAIESGSRFLYLAAGNYQTIIKSIKEGSKPEEILAQIVKHLELKRGTLEIENLLKILYDVMGSKLIIKEIDKGDNNFPWRDILADFICEWIFIDYAQNVNFFEKGTLKERIEKEDDIKDFIMVVVSLNLEQIAFEKLTEQQIKEIMQTCFSNVYRKLEEENFDE